MHPSGPPLNLTKSGPEFKERPVDYFIKGPQRPSFGDTPLYDTRGSRTLKLGRPSINVLLDSHHYHHQHQIPRAIGAPTSASALARLSIEHNHHAHTTPHYDNYDHYAHPFSQGKEVRKGSNESSLSDHHRDSHHGHHPHHHHEGQQQHHVSPSQDGLHHIHEDHHVHDDDDQHAEHHHHHHEEHDSQHPHEDHQHYHAHEEHHPHHPHRDSHHVTHLVGEDGDISDTSPSKGTKGIGLAFTKTMQQLHAYMSSMGFQGEAAKGHHIHEAFEHGTFPTKRLVSVHGERLLTSLRLVCQKLEILAVLPQIMSRLAIGDEELETVLGSECVEAVLQLLYIQMAWLEYRCPQPINSKSYMGKTLSQIKRRLQKGVRAHMTKLRFPGTLASREAPPTTEATVGSTTEVTDDDSLPAPPPGTKATMTSRPGRHSTKCSKDTTKKRKRSKPHEEPFTDEEREGLKEFIDEECSRTEHKVNRTMQNVMHQAIKPVQETTEEKVFRDIFYDTIRDHPHPPPPKKKSYVERQLEKFRSARKRKKHRPDCPKCLKDPKKCMRIDRNKQYQQIAGHCYFTVWQGEDADVNPLDQFLTESEFEMLPEETEEDYLRCIRGAVTPRSIRRKQKEKQRKAMMADVSKSETRSRRAARKAKKKKVRSVMGEAESEVDGSKKRKGSIKQAMLVRPISHDSGALMDEELAGEEEQIQSTTHISRYEEFAGEDSELTQRTRRGHHHKNRRAKSAPEDPQGNAIAQALDDSQSQAQDDASRSGYMASSEGANEKHTSFTSPSHHSQRTQSLISSVSFNTGAGSEPGEGTHKFHVRRDRAVAAILKDPTKSRFLRSLIGADIPMEERTTYRMKLQTKRLGLVKRALEGPYGVYVRRALREKNVKELLFLIRLDKNARAEFGIGEKVEELKRKSDASSRDVPLHMQRQTWRERWYGSGSEHEKKSVEARAQLGRGWRLVKDPRTGKLALIKHYKDTGGTWKSVRIRLNDKNKPETMTERKKRRLAKVERRLEREKRVQELQNAYGKQIPRIAYERYNKEKEKSSERRRSCKEDCEVEKLSSEESATSSEEDGDYTVVVTDPYPYKEPVKHKRDLEDLCLTKRPKSSAAESIGIPEKSESHKLGSIRVISATYNIGRVAAMEMPWIGPELFGVSADQYHSDQLQQAYREVLRVLSLNEAALKWVNKQIKPEVTQAVKIFYIQVQILQGLMYARLLMTPEEEITRMNYLKQTWIREQRLLRLLQSLQEEHHKLEKEREEMMVKLNESINNYIGQIDHAYLQSHQEISRTIAEYTKMELVTTKSADQALQELHGTLQKCIQVASIMRAKFSEAEDKLNKQKLKMEADLEALIAQYDSEMFARQEVLDQLKQDEEANKEQLAAIEKKLQKVEMRYNTMQEEGRLREAAERARMRSKKGKKKKRKGDKGKGKKGRKGGKKGGGSKGKGKGGKGKGGKKGGKKGKKGKKKKGGSEGEDESEMEGDESEGEGEDVPVEPKKKKGKKGKGGEGGPGKKGVKGKKGKGKKTKAPDKVPAGDEEEEYEGDDGEDDNEGEAPPPKPTKGKKGKAAKKEAAGTPAEPAAKKPKKGKKKKAEDEPPPEATKTGPKPSVRPSRMSVKGEDDDNMAGDFEEPPTPPNESAQIKPSQAETGDAKKKDDGEDDGATKKKGKAKKGKKK